jgi:nitrite reductase (NADH) small subunit
MGELRLPAANLPASVRAGALVIGVFKHGDRYYAIDNHCPHRGAPLDKGLQIDADIICPLHHFRFSLETGQCHLPKTLRARTFPVRREGEVLVIEVPD